MNKIVKLGLVAIVASLLFCASPTYARDEVTVEPFDSTNTTTVYVTANWLNIRQTAGLDYEPIDCISYGTELQMFGKTEIEGWVSIWYEDEIRYVSEKYVSKEEPEEKQDTTSSYIYSPGQFMNLGVIYWGNYRWTWYSERVLPGGGLNIPGRYTDSLGYVCDENGYICLASNDLSRGTVVDTPFGKMGKVYDSGCASGTLDVYVGW